PARRILAGSAGRRARRHPIANTSRRRAAASRNVPTPSEGELPALRPNGRDPESRRHPALRRARGLEGGWASSAGRHLHAKDRSSRGRRLLAILLALWKDGADGSQASPPSALRRRPQGSRQGAGRTRAMIVMGAANEEET